MNNSQEKHLWNVDLLLKGDDVSGQPEIDAAHLVASGVFQNNYADGVFQQLWREVMTSKFASDAYVASLRKAMVFVQRVELYSALKYCADYDDELRPFYDAANEFGERQRALIDAEIRRLLEARPELNIYSPALDYQPNFWNGYAGKVEALCADFNKFIAETKFCMDGEKISIAEAYTMMDLAADEQARRKIWQARNDAIMGDAFKEKFLGYLEQARVNEAERRKNQTNHNAPTNERGGFEDETAWLNAIGLSAQPEQGSYALLMHKYIALKAEFIGDQPAAHDTTLCLACEVNTAGKRLHAINLGGATFSSNNGNYISFEECKKIAHNIFSFMGDEISDFIADYFNELGFVDLGERTTKASYPYCIQSMYTPSFISTLYNGFPSDVTTAVHELAHAIHYNFCAKKKLPEEPPLIRDEFITAVFEIIATQEMITKCSDDNEHKACAVDELIDGVLQSVVTSASFHTMEKYIHDSDKMPPQSELEAKWRELTIATFGSAFEEESYMSSMYEDPYFMDPLYSHTYSKTMCLALAVVEQYNKAANKSEFGDKMRQFMQEPGGKPLEKSMEDVFGIEAGKSWRVGTQWISEQLSELDRLLNQKAREVEADVTLNACRDAQICAGRSR